MCMLSCAFYFLPNNLPKKPVYSLPASGSLTFGLVGLDFAKRDEPPTVLFNAAVFFAISLRLASALISAAFLASATFFAAARFFCFNASAFALASAAFFLSAACLAIIASRRLFVSIVLPAYVHAIQQNKNIVFVSQRTNAPTNAVVEINQSINQSSTSPARVDNKLSMRAWLTYLASPRTARAPAHPARARFARDIFLYITPFARARQSTVERRVARANARTRCDPRPNAFAREWDPLMDDSASSSFVATRSRVGGVPW